MTTGLTAADAATHTATHAAAHEVVVGVRGLTKTFALGFWRKRVVAVEGASFEVRRGEVFGLVGPNGAGKTTTIKMLLGLIKPSGGEAEILGHPIGSLESRRKVGYLPEISYYYDYLTPEEILDFYGRLYGMTATERGRHVKELLGVVGLEKARGKPLRKFSKGMLQRVGLAQALLSDPEVVVLDEPQSGLDPLGRKEVSDLIVSLKERGKTVFFSSHILPDVERTCDRIAVMMEGKVVDVGPLGTLLNPRRLLTEVVIEGALPPQVEEAVKAAAAGVKVEGRGGVVTLLIPGGVDAQGALRALVEGGVGIERVVPRHESLEDVFVRRALEGKGATE
jgi:ABC-2 type transport system ATP-binding protein